MWPRLDSAIYVLLGSGLVVSRCHLVMWFGGVGNCGLIKRR